jgi:CHAT domain-containing protein
MIRIFYICIILMMSSVYTLFAQEWQEYYQSYKDDFANKDFDHAIISLNNALLIIEDNKLLEGVDYALVLSELGELYYITKEYQNSIVYYQKSNKVIAKNESYINICIANFERIADAYFKLKDLKKSRKYYLEVLDLRENNNDKSSIEYSNTCKKIARVCIEMRKISEADEYYFKCKQIIETNKGKESFEYLEVNAELAEYYRRRRQYDKAENLYKENLELSESLSGVSDTLYACNCENLALFYMRMSKYKEAEKLVLKTKDIFANQLPKDDKRYIDAVYNLAFLYKSKGEYILAEPLYSEVKKLIEQKYSSESIQYAKASSDLARLYTDMGLYEAAEPLYVESMGIIERELGKENLEYAKISNDIASLYVLLKDYRAAEPIMIESKGLKSEIYGTKSITYAIACNNLAYLYLETNKFGESEKLFKQAIKIYDKKYGKNHPLYINYIKAINNLGTLYINKGSYNNAEETLLECKEIAKNRLGDTHPYYAEICNNLARLYRLKNNLSLAETYYYQSIGTIETIMKNGFGLLSEKEKEQMFETFAQNFDDFYSFALLIKNSKPEIIEDVFNTAINNKGMLLKSSTAMRYAILSSNDEALLSKYDKWVDVKIQISDYYAKPLYQRGDNLKNLEAEANSLERELIAGSQMFADGENEKNINWIDIKNSLNQDELAIEYIHFKDYNDSVYYCALVVKPDSEYPEMIKLFEESLLQNIFGRFLMNNLKYINSLYGDLNNGNTKLYNLIWQPLEKSVGDYKTIYISPTGLLHKISFSALCKETNVFLCDVYDINYKTSTSKLTSTKTSHIEDVTALVIGGVQYNTEDTEDNVWKYLPGTRAETDSITDVLDKQAVNLAYYYDADAKEAYFKEEASSYNVMHISTHGFFYPDPKALREKMRKSLQDEIIESRASANGDWGFGQFAFALNKHALMRSGLVLAGANDVWNKGAFPQPMVEDGVLTAMEVSQLNLLNVQLAVMSACETGLGDIRGSEGVYGLQRAFKLAGVDYLIMSLWKVPDKETKELMTLFYNNLIVEKDIKIAFSKAQQQMREKYDPYFWAAFVLVD